MELKDLKDPIEIIKLIQTLLNESIDEAIRTEDKKTSNQDIFEMWEGTVGKVYRLVDSKLTLLDIALINLKLENEEKYYKLKEIVCRLDDEIEDYYQNQEEYSPYPTPPPKIIKNHVRDLQVFQFVNKSNNNQSNDLTKSTPSDAKEEDDEIPKFEISTIPERVRLLMELGIIEHLEKEYPILKGKKKKLTELLMQFLHIPYSSLQPIVNAIEYDEDSPKKPKLTNRVKNVINKYK
jgi:hypothetical protein